MRDCQWNRVEITFIDISHTLIRDDIAPQKDAGDYDYRGGSVTHTVTAQNGALQEETDLMGRNHYL